MSTPSNGKTASIIAISIAVALAVTLTFNFTINIYYIEQIVQNIVEDVVDAVVDEKIAELQPPQVNQTPPVPQPVPIPPPQPTPAPAPIDNDTVPTPVPVPEPTPVPAPQPTPVPPTPPAPTATPIKVIVTADVEDADAGNRVFNAIKARNANNVIVLGDLGYEETLTWFKNTYGTLGNKLNCVIGNHDANEDADGNTIQAETVKFCGNSWYFKKNSVLFIGFNTNGDLNKQATEGGALLQNSQFMTGIKSVHIMSHKGCAVPPNSHHPVEVKAFCDAVKAKIPTTVKAYWDSGHNHVMSESADKTYKQSGAGGRSHYSCPTSVTTAWWCNAVNYGFLEYTIQPDGTTTHQWFDYNGRVLR